MQLVLAIMLDVCLCVHAPSPSIRQVLYHYKQVTVTAIYTLYCSMLVMACCIK